MLVPRATSRDAHETLFFWAMYFCLTGLINLFSPVVGTKHLESEAY